MSKARQFGFTGYQDCWESCEAAFDELEKEGILRRPSNEQLRVSTSVSPSVSVADVDDIFIFHTRPWIFL